MSLLHMAQAPKSDTGAFPLLECLPLQPETTHSRVYKVIATLEEAVYISLVDDCTMSDVLHPM